MSDEITVTRNEARSRYEVHVGDELGGYLLFRPAENAVVLPHTVIDPAFKGKGLGSILAADALADLARRGDTIIPTCPFVTHYLQTHEVPGLRIEWPSGDADAPSPAEGGERA